MRGATLYLNDMLEEREREQRRRARRAFAGSALVALLGFAMALRKPPTPDPKVVFRDRTVEVECSVTQPATPATPPKPTILRQSVVRFIDPLPPGPNRNIGLLDAQQAHHLCVTPRRLGLGGASGSDTVTISNVGERPISITQIGTISNRDASGFVVDAHRCSDRQLQPGERCTISVGLREAKRETMYLLIANSEEEPDWLRVDS
jgi:hypothetical protein